MSITNSQLKWVRSKDGLLAGICQGLGERFEIEVWLLRLIWIISFFCFGSGLVVYLLLAICLPREDKLDTVLQRRVLGVCSLIAVRYDFEIGLVRFLTVLFALSSFGLAVVVYVAMYFFLPKETDQFASMNSSRRF